MWRYVVLCGAMWRYVTLSQKWKKTNFLDFCNFSIFSKFPKSSVALCGAMWRYVALCGAIPKMQKNKLFFIFVVFSVFSKSPKSSVAVCGAMWRYPKNGKNEFFLTFAIFQFSANFQEAVWHYVALCGAMWRYSKNAKKRFFFIFAVFSVFSKFPKSSVAVCGAMWRYVALCGAIMRYPKNGKNEFFLTFAIFQFSADFQAVWRYVALCGAMWRYVALCGAMWRYVALFQKCKKRVFLDFCSLVRWGDSYYQITSCRIYAKPMTNTIDWLVEAFKRVARCTHSCCLCFDRGYVSKSRIRNTNCKGTRRGQHCSTPCLPSQHMFLSRKRLVFRIFEIPGFLRFCSFYKFRKNVKIQFFPCFFEFSEFRKSNFFSGFHDFQWLGRNQQTQAQRVFLILSCLNSCLISWWCRTSPFRRRGDLKRDPCFFGSRSSAKLCEALLSSACRWRSCGHPLRWPQMPIWDYDQMTRCQGEEKVSKIMSEVAMDQYLYIPFLGGWISIYQLFWCELQGYKVLTHCQVSKSVKMCHLPWWFLV